MSHRFHCLQLIRNVVPCGLLGSTHLTLNSSFVCVFPLSTSNLWPRKTLFFFYFPFSSFSSSNGCTSLPNVKLVSFSIWVLWIAIGTAFSRFWAWLRSSQNDVCHRQRHWFCWQKLGLWLLFKCFVWLVHCEELCQGE